MLRSRPLHDIFGQPDHRPDMTHPVDLKTLLPPALRRGVNVAARQLYGPHRRGWVSLLFKTWEDSRPEVHQMLVPAEFSAVNRQTDEIWAVTLILEGDARLREPFAEGPAPPGTILWFHGDGRRIPFRAGPGLRECSFTLEGRTARRLEDAGLLRFAPRVSHQPLTARVVMEYLDLFQALQEATASTESILRRVMIFLEHLEPPTPLSGAGADWVRRACEILERNVEPGFTMREAARQAGVGYREFRRGFRARLGCSPIAYQLAARMRRARQSLARRSVKETAHLLGYDDPFLFSRQFKRLLGCPPSSFRP